MDTPSSSDDKYRNIPLGVTIAVSEIVLMVGISIFVKMLSLDISTPTILLFRYSLCLPLLIVTALWQRGRSAFRITRYKILTMRIMAGLASLSCLYAALSLMSLAKVMTLFQATPLFITFMAPFILGETVGWRRWVAVLTGFVGVVVLLDPGAGAWSLTGVMFGLGSPVFAAIMMIMLRKLGQSDSPASTAIWYNGAGSILFLLLFFWRGEEVPTADTGLWILILIGVLSSFQQFFIAFSHRLAPASLLAPFRYLTVPVGIVAGIIFFDEALTATIILGSLIIVGSSVFILARES